MGKHFSTFRHDVWLPYKFAVGQVFKAFYDGLKEEKILGNQCQSCGKIFVPPRSFCPDCNVDMGDYTEVSQEGEIVTWTLAKEAFFGSPLDPPFITALIRLDGVSCDLLHLVGGFDLSDVTGVRQRIKKNRRVRAVWNDEKQGHLLDIKYFEPL